MDVERRGKAGAARDVRPARRGSTSCSSSSRTASKCSRCRAKSTSARASRSSDSNREHLLREQMRTIQKELGEDEDSSAEIAELDKAITEAKMPEEVEKQARKELKRLERMPEGAGEYSMIRTLSRLADRAAVGGRRGNGDRHRRGAAHPRRGPLRSREDQEAHSRVSRGAQAQSGGQEPDPVLRRPARRGQDLARPEHRQGDRPQVRAREPGRRARRGGDPRPPAHLHRLAAGQHHPEPAQGRARATA